MVRRLMMRLLSLLAVLVAALTLTFVLLRLSPGNPFLGERDLTPAQIAAKEREYKLDGPMVSQVARWWGDALQGDLRQSLKARNFSVREILAQSLPVSFALGGIAFLLAATGGVVWGALAAARRNQLTDRLAMTGALLAISLPAFVTGPVLVLVFGLVLGWLPAGGWGDWTQVILPAICLAVPGAASVARLMRNSMIETLGMEFIRTARAKGLPESQIVTKHALKMALLPVVSYLGPLAANLLTGSVVVESVFAIPGAGQHFVNSIVNRDGFLLQGAVAVYGTLLVGMNFLVDALYSALDPRIRRHE